MLQKVRQLKRESTGAASAGFTIIEVMIVLAIAGLIMAIVFLAIPALQRNNRNTQRKNDASRLAGLINDFVSNNNGKLPTGFGTGSGQLDLASETFSIIDKPTTLTNLPGSPPAPAEDKVAVYNKAKCDNNAPVDTPSARAFVVYYGIEGATKTQCLDS